MGIDLLDLGHQGSCATWWNSETQLRLDRACVRLHGVIFLAMQGYNIFLQATRIMCPSYSVQVLFPFLNSLVTIVSKWKLIGFNTMSVMLW